MGDPRQTAIRILARRAHATAELQRKLEQRGFTPEQVEQGMAYAVEYGGLDDGEFARMLCDEAARTGRGRFWAKHKLRQAGVAEDLALVAMDASLPAETEAVRLHAWLEQRGTLPDAEQEYDHKERARLHRSLERRGFDHQAIHQVLSGRYQED